MKREQLRKALRRAAEKASVGKPERAYNLHVKTGRIVLRPGTTRAIYKTAKRIAKATRGRETGDLL